MPANPFVRLYEAPTATLTDAAYALVLVAALVATWWVLGRNLLYLDEHWQDGWLVLVPLEYAVRTIGTILILAVDLALLAAIIAIL